MCTLLSQLFGDCIRDSAANTILKLIFLVKETMIHMFRSDVSRNNISSDTRLDIRLVFMEALAC